MYAVVNTGGKQYKVQQGEVLRIEKIPGEIGSPVSFDRVLMFSDGENVSVGQPVLDNVAVEGHIVEQGKAKKIIVFKYKRRKRYRRKQGHRQEYTAVQIDSIKEAGADAEQAPEPEKEAKPEVVKADAKVDTAPKAAEDAAEKSAGQAGDPKAETGTQKAAAQETGGGKAKIKPAEADKPESGGEEA